MTEFRVAAVGDIMLGGTAGPELMKRGYDYPFEHVRTHLRAADIVFGNLEGPLTDRGVQATAKQYTFRSPPERVATALAGAGFNVLSLANNHILDYGTEGLDDTLSALSLAGIQSAGAGSNLAAAREFALLRAGNTKVAVLAYSLTFPEEFWATSARAGTAFGHEDHVRADVMQARRHADVVLVSFHWGREGTTGLRDYQRQLGRVAIDAGAAAVIGHHPHVLQGIERYRDGVILYSLGNFTFGSFSTTAIRSVIATLDFRAQRLHEVRLLPINVNNVEVVFQPRPLIQTDADQVIETLRQLSQQLNTTIENRDGVAVLTFDREVEAPTLPLRN